LTTLQQNRWGEWTFAGQGQHDDPFNQVELTVCFTNAATGAEKRVPAFWAGGREWRVRFAAHEVCYEGIGAYCGPELQRWLFWACMLNGAVGNWVSVVPGTPAWFPRPIYQDWLLLLRTATRGIA
jgi:hypothetical protein